MGLDTSSLPEALRKQAGRPTRPNKLGYTEQHLDRGFATIHEIEQDVRAAECGAYTLYFSHPTFRQKQVFKLSAEQMCDKIRQEFDAFSEEKGYKCATFGEDDFAHWSQHYTSGGKFTIRALT